MKNAPLKRRGDTKREREYAAQKARSGGTKIILYGEPFRKNEYPFFMPKKGVRMRFGTDAAN